MPSTFLLKKLGPVFPVADYFSTDGSLNGRLTEIGGKTWSGGGSISGGVLNVNNGDAASVTTGVPNGDIEWRITRVPSPGGLLLLSFASGVGGNAYQVRIFPTSLSVQKVVAGNSGEVLASVGHSGTSGQPFVLRFRSDSATGRVRVSFNGSQIVDVIDTFGNIPTGTGISTYELDYDGAFDYVTVALPV